MLQNAYFLAKIGADTAENEQHFAEILRKTGNYPTGPAWSAAAATEDPHVVIMAGPRPVNDQTEIAQKNIIIRSIILSLLNEFVL